ncbi:MAG: hypothetical protein EOO63_16350 [Hymenobacter sp.]|nr:MAG: hypothetical protein EOO63_16350 [Hymenobacter sp.]
MLLLAQKTGFLLLHDSSHNWLYASWTGPNTAEGMCQHHDLLLQQVCRLKYTKLLNDSAQDCDGWRELSRWVATNCFLVLAESGIQAVAWVLPSDPPASRDQQRVLASVKAPLLDVFQEVEAAYNWLLKWPQQV